MTNVGLIWPKSSTSSADRWGIDDVRRAVSIPVRFHVAEPLAGGVPRTDGQPSYTFRIKAGAKAEIRERLRTLFGYEHSTIYPDFPGFSAYAKPYLSTRQP